MNRFFKLLLSTLLLVSCSVQEDRDTLKIAVPLEPVSLTPFTSNDIASYRVRWQIFDRLVSINSQGQVESQLALSWRTVNPTTIQLSLRTNVTFHNGQQFTAEDAQYSINKAVTSSYLSAVLGIVKEAVAIDEFTVQVTFKQEYADGVKILAHPGMLMASHQMMESGNPEDHYVGTGPFKFVAWNRGQNVQLAKNPDYWGVKASLEGLEFMVVPDASVRLITVETGDADIAYDIDGSDRERLLSEEKVTYIEVPSPTIHYLGFNLKKDIYNNLKFRDAVALAIDFNGLVQNVAFGAGEPATSLLQSSISGATNLAAREQNLAKAKELLAEVNIPENFVMPIYAIEGPRKKMAEIIQANLLEVGLNVEVRILEWATMLDYARKGNLESFVMGWTTIPAIADIGLFSLMYSQNTGVGGNYTYYSNQLVDQLLLQARKTADSGKQDQMYHQIQEIIYNEKPLIPLFHPYVNIVTRSNVENVKINPFSVHELNTVTFKKK